MFKLNTLGKYILVVTFIALSISLKAQQQGQYSQYMMNYFLVNPAAAGTEDFIDIKSGYRNQWGRIDGAPKNYYLSAHLPINKLHSNHRKIKKKADAYPVFGAMFSGQQLGAISHNTGYLSYAYHLPLTAEWIMSMGAVAGLNQTALGDLTFSGDQYDPAVATYKKTKFDMGLGIWLYSKNLFFGLSSMQILQNKLQFSDTRIGDGGVLNRHFYLTGGYKIQINDLIQVIPSALVKHTSTAFQVDLNAKMRYKNICWGGISYRKADAFVLLAGVEIPLTNYTKGSGHRGSGHGNDTHLLIGYSYDLGASKLRTYSGGAHEIMLGLTLPTGGRVRSPSDYW